MIPKSELQHYEATNEVQAIREEMAEEDARARWQASLRAQCADLIRRYPLLWQWLEEHAAPACGPPLLMPPEMALPSGQMMAYRMGQHSIVRCIRDNATLAQEGEADAQGAPGDGGEAD